MVLTTCGLNLFGQVQSGSAYTIVNRYSGLALYSPNKNSGTQMQQWACNGGTQQNWIFTSVGLGYYELRNQASGEMLDNDASQTPGTAIVQQPFDGYPHQNWSLTPIDGGYYTILNENSGEALDDMNASTVNGAGITQYTSNGGEPQQWLIVPANNCRTGQTSITTTIAGFESMWQGFALPAGQLNLLTLGGTISLTSNANIFSEELYMVGFMTGSCPSSSTTPLPAAIWTYMIKSENSGTITIPINYIPPAGIPISNCLVVGIGGGTPSRAHTVSATISMSATYAPGSANSSQTVGIGAEFCFGTTSGCELATTQNNLQFAVSVQISQPETLVAIWGDVSDAAYGGTPPSGSWTASNDLYIFYAPNCQDWPPGTSLNLQAPYLSMIPPGSTHVFSDPLSATGVAAVNSSFYQTYSYSLQPGDCLINIFGVNNNGGFDNEDQLTAIVVPQ